MLWLKHLFLQTGAIPLSHHAMMPAAITIARSSTTPMVTRTERSVL